MYVNSDRIRTVYADLESVKLIISFLRNAGQYRLFNKVDFLKIVFGLGRNEVAAVLFTGLFFSIPESNNGPVGI